MLKMRTNYVLTNMALEYPGLSGVSMSFKVSTPNVFSALEICLKNSHHEVCFQIRSDRAVVGTKSLILSTQDGGATYTVPGYEGRSETLMLGTAKEISATLHVKGDTLGARVTAGGVKKRVSFKVSDVQYSDIVEGWAAYVSSSNPLGTPSTTRISSLYLVGDASPSGRIVTEYITLTATDVQNKYVTLVEAPVFGTAVNIAQATSQREGIDFLVVENTLVWGGYGLDIPQVQEGITMRVSYYTGTFGDEAYMKIGKKVVALRD